MKKKFWQGLQNNYGIEWEQKGTHEEHLDVYNFKKKEAKKGSTGAGAGERVSNCRKRRN